MGEINNIKEIISETALRYENMLSTFRPTQPDGEYLEQNLITNFAISFVQKFPNAKIYTEIPFISDDSKGYWQNRLDLYIDNGDIGYIIEAKGSQPNDKLFNLIDKDIRRIKSKEMIKSFKNMSKFNLPKKMIGLVIADCWSGKNQEKNKQEQKWLNYKSDLSKFSAISLLDYTFSNEVNLKDSHYKYHILVGAINNLYLDTHE